MRRFGRRQRLCRGDAVADERPLPFHVARVLVARRSHLQELRVGFGDDAPSGLELGLDVRVLDCAITSPMRTRVPASNFSDASRPPVFTPTSLLRRATTPKMA